MVRDELVGLKNDKYLITGFPLTVKQALLFEANFGEIHSIIYIDISLEAIKERMQDEKDESIEQKMNDYKTDISPLLEYYEVLGKVRRVNGDPSPPDVYKEFVEASLPQLFFFIGPRCSGKTTICKFLAERTNMTFIDFKVFLNKKRFATIRNDPEGITKELIKYLHTIKASRVIIEGFPESSKQLLCFILNGIKPRGCVFLRASESSCLTFSTKKTTKCDVSSAILCKLIKEFYKEAKEMVEILKKHECLIELTNSQETSIELLLEIAANKFDPEVILMRSDESNKESMDMAIKEMREKLQYRTINIKDLIRIEVKRNTNTANEMIKLSIEGKFITEESTIKLLRRYLYTIDGHSKFLLIGFSDEVSHLQLLEKKCCNITKEFYFYPQQAESIIRLDIPTIETYMHKNNKLIPLTLFEAENMERYYGNQLTYAVIMGAPLSGKTTVAKMLERSGFTLLDTLVITEEIKKKLATEDNPAETITITLDQLVGELKLIITTRKNKREKFVLDGFSLEDSIAIDKIISLLGPPAFFIELLCTEDTLKERYKKKNEIPELSEDQIAELDKTFAVYNDLLKYLQPLKEAAFVKVLKINTEVVEESTLQEMKGLFEPDLILITQHANIVTDDILTNFSIKYDFLYIPLHTIIKTEIHNNSEIGKELKRTRKFRNTVEKTEEYCPVHYETKLLIALVKDTIKKLRVEEKFVLVDGLLNTNRLKEENDKMELRVIDELLVIEKDIGEIRAIIRLTYDDYENIADDRVAVKKVIEEKKEAKEEVKEEIKKEDEEEVAPPPQEEEKEDKPKFNPDDYAWTDTKGKPRNIGQFFSGWKKCTPKNMVFNLMEPSTKKELVLDSIMPSIISGQLSKTKTYFQVKFSS